MTMSEEDSKHHQKVLFGIGQQDDQQNCNKRNSRRHAWIQKRWKTAMRSVATIGFKTFEDFLRLTSDDMENMEGFGCAHEFGPLSHCQQQIQFLCIVCKEESQTEDQPLQQCQKCRINVHSGCQNFLPCGSSASKNLSKSKINFIDSFGIAGIGKKQKSSASADDSSTVNFGEDEDGLTNNERQQQQVDPIYLALKKGNKMANLRKSSVADCGRAFSQTRETTPCSITADPITTRSAPAPNNGNGISSNSNNVNAGNNSGAGVKSKPAADMPTCSSYASIPSSNTGQGSSPSSNVQPSSSKQSSPKIGSAPNLLAQKSIESADEVGPIRKPSALQKTARRAPKLDSKMKSLSLDCADATNSRKSSVTPNLIPNRHALRVPPVKYSSFESDDTAQSSNSGSPCPSSICGSTLALPSNSYAVTHDYYAKFPEEIDLRVGERVLVVDNSDQDWWQGHNVTGRLGIFPSTCVAHIHCNEQVMQVVQNVCLWVGNKNTRLYRDQIVFAQLDEFVAEGLVTVRTERDHRINCPLQYLMSLE